MGSYQLVLLADPYGGDTWKLSNFKLELLRSRLPAEVAGPILGSAPPDLTGTWKRGPLIDPSLRDLLLRFHVIAAECMAQHDMNAAASLLKPVACTWIPTLFEIMGENIQKQPKEPSFYILLGFRYLLPTTKQSAFLNPTRATQPESGAEPESWNDNTKA